MMAFVLGLGAVAAACGKDNGVLSPGGAPIASPEFCGNLNLAICDQRVRCGRDTAATCRAAVAVSFEECPLIVEAVVRDEVDYDEDAAGAFVDDARAMACDVSLPDPVARGVFTPRQDAGLICHSVASCKPGFTCLGHTTSSPEGTCR